jgi:hypothetical protein
MDIPEIQDLEAEWQQQQERLSSVLSHLKEDPEYEIKNTQRLTSFTPYR